MSYLRLGKSQLANTTTTGLKVGQVRLIFRASVPLDNPSFPFLVYTDSFQPIKASDAPLGLHRVSKAFDSSKNRIGEVLALSSIVRPCPLQPVINGSAPGNVNDQTSMQQCSNFWINQFDNHVDYRCLK